MVAPVGARILRKAALMRRRSVRNAEGLAALVDRAGVCGRIPARRPRGE
jgi:hypothetical protein